MVLNHIFPSNYGMEHKQIPVTNTQRARQTIWFWVGVKGGGCSASPAVELGVCGTKLP